MKYLIWFANSAPIRFLGAFTGWIHFDPVLWKIKIDWKGNYRDIAIGPFELRYSADWHDVVVDYDLRLGWFYELKSNWNYAEPTKRISVWLDDKRPTPIGMARAYTAQEAISLLKTGNVKHISFDHDLGPVEAGTGYDVAWWIESQAAAGELLPLAWEIHSSNPVGRKNIKAAMESAERFWGLREIQS